MRPPLRIVARKRDEAVQVSRGSVFKNSPNDFLRLAACYWFKPMRVPPQEEMAVEEQAANTASRLKNGVCEARSWDQ